ncbi:hypothetical protein J4G43_004930 [Bradyrhizobium barranii subsp. barranii]|uniref:Uncharacterized protein n=1 Tax=Bradyrhizobium barranii subsp. barranii TaxID=2823807 RepID=A0A939S1P6_9BRAD|nr:hypothetical protein [Bradyrhizobium barranii]UEM13668.1 hypothetical protein J4G43_004930 [Bradyrhizobium barranii subsp. barranii]
MDAEYNALAVELQSAVPEAKLLEDFPLVFSQHGLRELRKAGQVKFVRGPRGEIVYPRAEALRMVRERMGDAA